jgi:DNA-binding CsgD family transcriptional regulator
VEMDLLKALLPHLQRAVQIHGRFVELQGKQRASLDALDQLPIGVILLNQDTSIAAMNREAGRVIGQNDGLSACKYGVRAAGTATNRQLQALIASAVRTGSGQDFEGGGFLAIPRASGQRAFSVLVTAVGKRAFAPDTNSPAAVVFVTDPERIPESAAQSLARIYELTAAECRLSELLMQGETLVRAADHLGISHNTARTHLQRIYEKTGTCHQGDLIRLLTTGIPNFAPK